MGRKFNVATLFEPWEYGSTLAPYKTQKAALNAVKSRKKALVFTGMSLAHIAAGGKDFTKLLSMAFERDLAVILHHKHTSLPVKYWDADAYVMHLDQAWCVPAHIALWATAFEEGAWTYAAEAQQSLLFGYTAKQRAAWIASERHRQAAYGNNTIYTLLTEEQREQVMSVGRRCFGPVSAAAGMTFFFSLQRDATKKNAAKLLPKGTVLARAGLDWRTSEALFGRRSTWLPRNLIFATASRKLASKVNTQLRSNVQFFTASGWK